MWTPAAEVVEFLRVDPPKFAGTDPSIRIVRFTQGFGRFCLLCKPIAKNINGRTYLEHKSHRVSLDNIIINKKQ